MLEIFDILQEPKFWLAMVFGLAPIATGIVILWESRRRRATRRDNRDE